MTLNNDLLNNFHIKIYLETIFPGTTNKWNIKYRKGVAEIAGVQLYKVEDKEKFEDFYKRECKQIIKDFENKKLSFLLLKNVFIITFEKIYHSQSELIDKTINGSRIPN